MNDQKLMLALSSVDNVREVARIITFNSDGVHAALRRLSATITGSESVASYALLTEEYALRARAHILENDANRFVVNDFDVTQEDLLVELKETEARFAKVENIDELSELLIALILFSNAIVSRKNSVLRFLFKNLSETRKRV